MAVENPTVKEQVLEQIMMATLMDRTQSWLMGPDGSYQRLEESPDGFSAHEYFMTNPSCPGGDRRLRKSRPELPDMSVEG